MKKTIALVTGGYSGESVISYKTALTIENNIDAEKWICYVIDIRPEGWFYKEDDESQVPVDKNDFSIVSKGKKINFHSESVYSTPIIYKFSGADLFHSL